MINYNTSELKIGLKVLIEGIPMIITENHFVNPGKGQAFNRLTLKNLLNYKIVDKTIKNGETVQAADIEEMKALFSYFDNDSYVFMHPETFEQHHIVKENMSGNEKWIKPQEIYQLVLFNGKPIDIIPPNFIDLEVVETEPGIKGDSTGKSMKLAKLSTGATVKVPLFIQEGELIKIDTRKSIYVSRVKS